MGDVWRGTDEVLGRTVAVKILLPALLDEPGFAERFRGEARTMATINHPGVVDIYDYGSDQQLAFLVMEYVEGDALSRTLSRVGRLTPARTMALVAQAADALQAAHEKGIVHRDVKPGNLLVRPNGTLVLTDFGIARSAGVGAAHRRRLGARHRVVHLARAGAPARTATPPSDVYALGVVAYQCLSGHRPFEGDNPLEIAMKHVRETPRPLPGRHPARRSARSWSGRWPRTRPPAGPPRRRLAAVARQAAATLAGGAAGRRPGRRRCRRRHPVRRRSGRRTGGRSRRVRRRRIRRPTGRAGRRADAGARRHRPRQPRRARSGTGLPSCDAGAATSAPGRASVRGGACAGGVYGRCRARWRRNRATWRNRNGLITVAVVVGMLALLACIGVIGVSLSEQGASVGMDQTSEGRQTR